MEERLKLSKASTAVKVDMLPKHRRQAALPDSHTVGHLVHYRVCEQVYGVAVKHLLCYIKGMTDLGVAFPKIGEEEMRLRGFSDSDMAGDIDGWRSTSSMFFFLGSSPVAW
jgi:hypothetical protein